MVAPKLEVFTTDMKVFKELADITPEFMRGANIVMPNLTPPKYRALYEIYPAKACIRETAEKCHGCMGRRIASIGRSVGAGAGGAPSWERARAGLAREESPT